MAMILALSVFIFFCCNSRAQISVQQGDISEANSATAIASMTGDALLKQVWWDFLPPRQRNPDEFLRYMLVPRTTCAGEVMSSEIQSKQRLLGTREASIADYHSVEQLKGLGRMEVTMWTLAFLCAEEPSLQTINSPCRSVTPVILKEWNGSRPGFFTLWEADQQNSTVFVNSFTAKVSQLNREIHNSSIPEVTLRVVPQSSIRPCFIEDVLLRTNTSWSTLPIRLLNTTDGGYYQCNDNTENNLCSLGIASFESGERDSTTTTEVDNIGRLLSQLKNSYVQAHNSALNLEQGPPTDFWLVAIALPSTFIAVLTATVPLTDAQLRLFRPTALRKKSRYLKFGLLSLCNLMLSFLSYSAVAAIAPGELQRQNSFRTWALHADQVQVGDFSGGLRLLVVMTGESKYKSNSLIVAWVTGSLLLPLVAALTFYRCYQVHMRQKLLMMLRALRPDLPGNAGLDDLQAVEMTLPEYLLLKDEIQGLENHKIEMVRSATVPRRF